MSEERRRELNEIFTAKALARYTGFHEHRNLFLEPEFNMNGTFNEKMMQLLQLKMLLKVGLITFASAGFGVVMGFIMSTIFDFKDNLYRQL